MRHPAQPPVRGADLCLHDRSQPSRARARYRDGEVEEPGWLPRVTRHVVDRQSILTSPATTTRRQEFVAGAFGSLGRRVVTGHLSLATTRARRSGAQPVGVIDAVQWWPARSLPLRSAAEVPGGRVERLSARSTRSNKITCGIDRAEGHHDIALVVENGQMPGRRRITESVRGVSRPGAHPLDDRASPRGLGLASADRQGTRITVSGAVRRTAQTRQGMGP